MQRGLQDLFRISSITQPLGIGRAEFEPQFCLLTLHLYSNSIMHDPLTQSLYSLRVPSEQSLPYNTEKYTGEQSTILFEKWVYFG